MSHDTTPADRRQFGRRQTLWHAWIKIAGRAREPCIVRNFSVTGALLEFAGAVPVVDRFRLIIDVHGFEADCYVRHRSRVAVGVYFDDIGQAAQPSSSPRPEEIVARVRHEARARRH